MKFTLKDLKKLGPCEEGLEWAKNQKSAKRAWETCEMGDWLLWLLERIQPITKSQAVAISVACAKDCIAQFEARYPSDDRPRKAIEATELWLKSPTGSAAWSAARSAAESAWSAAESAWSAAESAAWSAAESAESAAWSAAESAWSAAESARSAARSAAESARSAARSAAESARSAAWSAAESARSAARSAAESAWSAARKRQADFIRAIVPCPF